LILIFINCIGWEGNGLNSDGDDEKDMLLANGTRLNLKDVVGLLYAQAGQEFGYSGPMMLKSFCFRSFQSSKKPRDSNSHYFFCTQ
jgi:hypothetical protein